MTTLKDSPICQWCFWTVVLENTLENPLDFREIKPVLNQKGNQPWIFTGRTDAEAEAPYFDCLMQRTNSLEKTLMLGMIEGRRRRGRQKMRQLNSIMDSMDNEFKQAPGVGDGQESLACCDSWGHTESDTTEQLNWAELMFHGYPVHSLIPQCIYPLTCWWIFVLFPVYGCYK